MSGLAGLLLFVVFTAQAGADPVTGMLEWLKQPSGQRSKVEEQPFADMPLTRDQALQVRKLLENDQLQLIRQTRSEEWKERAIKIGALTMKFDVRVFGEKPAAGRSLYISMHGGGNTAKATNDKQWENQKRLYQPAEGVYIAPRAPNDAWDMWFQPHMDGFFARLIQDAVVFEDVDVNRVYLMGYSAGGDGVFRLAPRLADRWAAAAMMAGHPGDVQADNLRNLPFTLHMGENDKAYDRNKRAAEWKTMLADLREKDKEGFVHEVVIQPGMGHWMQKKDAIAIPWMAKFTRNTAPKHVVWNQPKQAHFYWLSSPVIKTESEKDNKSKAHIAARIEGQTIRLTTTQVSELTLRLRDDLLDLDKPIKVIWNDKQVVDKVIQRTVKAIAKTLDERLDAGLCYDAEVAVKLP